MGAGAQSDVGVAVADTPETNPHTLEHRDHLPAAIQRGRLRAATSRDDPNVQRKALSVGPAGKGQQVSQTNANRGMLAQPLADLITLARLGNVKVAVGLHEHEVSELGGRVGRRIELETNREMVVTIRRRDTRLLDRLHQRGGGHNGKTRELLKVGHVLNRGGFRESGRVRHSVVLMNKCGEAVLSVEQSREQNSRIKMSCQIREKIKNRGAPKNK